MKRKLFIGTKVVFKPHAVAATNSSFKLGILESLQDFLIKLDMKPCMHIVEINIFPLNRVIIRLTKIMSNPLEHLKICTFKLIFPC